MSKKPTTGSESSCATTAKPSITDFSIRRMRESDVEGIMGIESKSFGSHHWSGNSFINEMNNPMARYHTLLHHVRQSSGEKKKVVAGYCGFWIILDEAHITTVATAPKLRGLSLGEVQLLQMMEMFYNNSVHFATLEVRTSNDAAQNLYYKYGFTCAGRRPRYYQDNHEDALIMTTPDICTEEYRTFYKQKKQALKEKLGSFPDGFIG